jgi:hypothetical protein
VESFWFDKNFTNFLFWKLTNFDEWKCVSLLWEINSYNHCFSWLFPCVRIPKFVLWCHWTKYSLWNFGPKDAASQNFSSMLKAVREARIFQKRRQRHVTGWTLLLKTFLLNFVRPFVCLYVNTFVTMFVTSQSWSIKAIHEKCVRHKCIDQKH